MAKSPILGYRIIVTSARALVMASCFVGTSCADEGGDSSLPTSPFTCAANGFTPIDLAAIPDLGSELSGREIQSGWTTSFEDGASSGPYSGPSVWYRVGENGGGSPELLVASYAGADEAGVWFEHIAAISLAFDGLAAFGARDPSGASSFIAEGENAGYSWIDQSEFATSVDRVCAFAGAGAGSVGEGTIDKWCVTLDSGEVQAVDAGISAEWCDDNELCGGDGLMLNFDGPTTGEFPTEEYQPNYGVVGVYVSFAIDEMTEGLSAVQFATLSTHSMTEPDITDAPCGWYPDGDESTDDDGDGFTWYAVVQADLW